MDVHAFERLLGPCMGIMQRNIKDYEEQESPSSIFCSLEYMKSDIKHMEFMMTLSLQVVKIFGSKSNIKDTREKDGQDGD